MPDPVPGVVADENCWCGVCQQAVMAKARAKGLMVFRTFIVCPTCGNKRCPRATHHTHVCTSSNHSGQNGSFYGSPWPCDEVSEFDDTETTDA